MVIGLEVHCELATTTKLFCGCRNAFGDEPNVNICPVCLGLPGSLPVLNEQAVELAMRIGAALHCEIRPSDLRPEELLLPRPGQGLPDQPVRPAAQRGRLARAARRVPGRGHAGPHGGGHRQAHPRRRERPHQRGRPRAGRLQPLGRAAGRDRERARHPLRRPGPGLRRRAARHPRGHRRVRRPHGGGLHARRRQRVGAARRDRRVRHALRDQEPQLAALAGAGHRVRGGAPDRGARGRRRRSPRRRGTGTSRPGAPSRCAPRRRRTTTGTSPSPTWCRWRPTPAWQERVRAGLGPDAGRPPCRAGRRARRRRRATPRRTRSVPWSTWASTPW